MKRLNAADLPGQASHAHGCIDTGSAMVETQSRTLDSAWTSRRYSQCPGKLGNHTLNYGMKEKLLANNLGCTVDEAIALMDKYMNRYPAVKQFYAEAIEETRQTGYAFSLLGRRRFLPEIISMSEYDRFRAERQAVTMQIQGTAADAAKMAMILIDEAGLEEKYGCKMLLQVHDELLFECPEETAEEANAEIGEWMSHPFPSDLAVALTTEGSIADNWADAK